MAFSGLKRAERPSIVLLTGTLCCHQRQRLRYRTYCCRVEAAARANGNPTQASPDCESFCLKCRLVSHGCQLSTALESGDSKLGIQHFRRQILPPRGMTDAGSLLRTCCGQTDACAWSPVLVGLPQGQAADLQGLFDSLYIGGLRLCMLCLEGALPTAELETPEGSHSPRYGSIAAYKTKGYNVEERSWIQQTTVSLCRAWQDSSRRRQTSCTRGLLMGPEVRRRRRSSGW